MSIKTLTNPACFPTNSTRTIQSLFIRSKDDSRSLLEFPLFTSFSTIDQVDSIKWQLDQDSAPKFELDTAIMPPISEDELIGGIIEYPLEFGMLKAKDRATNTGTNRYWYWRYYNRLGKRKDKYMGKNLDRALAKVRAIRIPKDAQPQRRSKGKKLWAI